jgi:glycerophosphoryl diester phosphodiesterase
VRPQNPVPFVAAVFTALCASTPAVHAAETSVHLGPRPFYLVDKMSEGKLKKRLEACAAEIDTYEHQEFSIGHRGAALQFPEHTRESYRAADRMGAGIIECDVTFTKDAELVCRHAQCDLHTTTNILATPLADKCRVPFTPATFDPDGSLSTPATALCCTTDLTLAEFKSLEGKMDAFDPTATTVEEFLGGTPDFRTDLYATGGTLVTHQESIELLHAMGAGFTPELKGVDLSGGVPIVENDGFGESGLTQETYARKMIQEYINAGIRPERVWAQSFNLDDVLQWIAEFPEFGEQAVFLDGRDPAVLSSNPPPLSEFKQLKKAGVNIVSPPMPALLTTDVDNDIVPSGYAKNARKAGLDIISWTAERSGRIVEDVLNGGQEFYYQTTLDALENDGDILRTIDVLAQDVGIIGLFSDWPATTTFYANCVGLKDGKHGHDDDRERKRPPPL